MSKLGDTSDLAEVLKVPLTRSRFANTPPEMLAAVEAATGLTTADVIFDPEEDDYLAPEDAARRFLSNPASIGFNLMEFPSLFGLSSDEIGEEIEAGRLVAWSCRKIGSMGKSALVRSDNIIAWINNPETPKRIRKKLKRVAGGEVAFFARRAKCVPLRVGTLR